MTHHAPVSPDTASVAASLDGPMTAPAHSPVVTLGDRYLIRGPWGWTEVTAESVRDLATFTDLSDAEVIEHLADPPSEEKLDEEWRQAAPATQAAMRRFYESTHAYLWSLSLWTSTPQYEWYRTVCRRLAERQRVPGKALRALDYGSGIGETAITLAQLGYEVTIADVPGHTFAYAQHRLRRRGIPFQALTVTEDLPSLEGPYDAIVVFDVLEHVRAPDAVFRHLLGQVAPGGLLAEASAFDQVDGDYEGVHLAENGARWGDGRWRIFVSGQGPRTEWGCIHERAAGASALAHRLHYDLWRLSGLDVRYGRRALSVRWHGRAR